jgi:hypothetical protein
MLLRTIDDFQFLGIADRAREQPRKGPPADNRHPNVSSRDCVTRSRSTTLLSPSIQSYKHGRLVDNTQRRDQSWLLSPSLRRRTGTGRAKCLRLADIRRAKCKDRNGSCQEPQGRRCSTIFWYGLFAIQHHRLRHTLTDNPTIQ